MIRETLKEGEEGEEGEEGKEKRDKSIQGYDLISEEHVSFDEEKIHIDSSGNRVLNPIQHINNQGIAAEFNNEIIKDATKDISNQQKIYIAGFMFAAGYPCFLDNNYLTIPGLEESIRKFIILPSSVLSILKIIEDKLLDEDKFLAEEDVDDSKLTEQERTALSFISGIKEAAKREVLNINGEVITVGGVIKRLKNFTANVNFFAENALNNSLPSVTELASKERSISLRIFLLQQIKFSKSLNSTCWILYNNSVSIPGLEKAIFSTIEYYNNVINAAGETTYDKYIFNTKTEFVYNYLEVILGTEHIFVNCYEGEDDVILSEKGCKIFEQLKKEYSPLLDDVSLGELINYREFQLSLYETDDRRARVNSFSCAIFKFLICTGIKLVLNKDDVYARQVIATLYKNEDFDEGSTSFSRPKELLFSIEGSFYPVSYIDIVNAGARLALFQLGLDKDLVNAFELLKPKGVSRYDALVEYAKTFITKKNDAAGAGAGTADTGEVEVDRVVVGVASGSFTPGYDFSGSREKDLLPPESKVVKLASGTTHSYK